MRHRICEERSFSLACIIIFGLPSVAFSDPTDGHAHTEDGSEANTEIEYFNVGSSKSNIGNAQADASGMRIETEYETNNKVFSFNYERWNYTWTNPESLPFASGTVSDPWSTFTSLQFGFAYEQEIGDDWEFNYYIEAESSYEKERSRSNEYELGVDFTYEPSKTWAYTFNINLEYLDASGIEFGVDVEIEWNHDKKDGWSGEFEISSEFPETSLSYHFTKKLSTTFFYNEGGTNTIRLSDSSPVSGMQGGYLEDEYKSLGFRLAYEFAYDSYVSFSVQQNTGRSLSFVDSTGLEATETIFNFADTIEPSIRISYTF